MSQVTISGAVSGLDTQSIINQLVSVQGNQQTLLRTQQSSEQSAADALGKLSTALSSVGTLAGALAATSTWTGATTTSSSSAVTATATGTATRSLTFDVTQLAAAHALVSATAVASTSSIVASGTVTLTAPDGSQTAIAVGTGSLADVVAGINAANKGVAATAVQTSPGQYRLQVAATSTGAASAFTLDGIDAAGGMNVLTEGQDAAITIGSNPDTAYAVSSSSNTFSGLVPGLSFTVGKVESGVTVRASVDGTAVAGQVSKLVDAVNAVLAQISTATAYNTTTKSGGPLIGDSGARSLQQQLLSLVSGAGAAGVSLTRDGTLAVDQSAFLSAFAANPDKVKAAFGATSTFSAGVGVGGTAGFSSATRATRPGTYDLQITSRGAREQWSLSGNGGFVAGQVIHLERGTSSVDYTVQDGDGLDQIIAGLNAKASAANFGVTTRDDGAGGLLLTADSSGSAQAFSASLDGVQGTIDGQPAKGIGDILSLTSGTGGAVGLSLDTSGFSDADVAAAAGGSIGTVAYVPGLAQRLATLAGDETNSSTGVLTSAQQGRLTEVKNLQAQIDDWDTRLQAYRDQLTQQFTAMETALASLKSQTSSLAGLSTSMLSNSGSSSG
ncbi:MAG TPA: flagellar filament capping protein FliD [Kineosporiaceae bacterium]|nr:flagellar filament capping protein FliD [Kineosporiaceae bacterium]